jgi:hypothetical protein
MPPPRDYHHEVEEPQEYAERKPFRWGRFLLLSFLVLMVVLILGHWWWSRRGEKALLAQMEQYRNLGQPTAFEDFHEEDIPDAMNAAMDLRAAAAAIATTDADQKALNMAMRILPLTEKEVALLDKILGQQKAMFDHVQVAKTKPGVNWKIKLQSPMASTLLPDLNGQRQLAELLAWAALRAHERGEDAAAIGHVRDMLFVSRCIGRQPFLVSHLTSVGITALASDVLRQIAPDLNVTGTAGASGTPVDRKVVQEIIADLLDETPSRAAFRRALYSERLSQFDGTRLMARGNTAFLAAVMGGGGAPPAFALVTAVLRPIVYEDGVMMVRHTTAVAQSAQEETWPAAQAKVPEFPLEIKRSVLHLNASLFMPALSATAQRHYWTLMDRRATALVLAIRLHAIDHGGNLPEQLDDLVPAYLPKVPTDAFARDAGPMKYLRAPQPIVYSVNVNGQDDGGSKLDGRGRETQGHWNMLDAVFHLTRQPRPPEEVVAPDLSPDLVEPEVTPDAPVEPTTEPSAEPAESAPQ